MKFFCFDAAYLEQPFVRIAFWGGLIGGAISLGLSAWLHGTRWALPTAALGAFSMLDACILRYLFELKQTGLETKRSVEELLSFFNEANASEEE